MAVGFESLRLVEEIPIIECPIIIIIIARKIISSDWATILTIGTKFAVVSTAGIVTYTTPRVWARVYTSFHPTVRIRRLRIVNYSINTSTVCAVCTFNTSRNTIAIVFHVIVVIVCISIVISALVIILIIPVFLVVVVILSLSAIIADIIESEFATVVASDTFTILYNISYRNRIVEYNLTSTCVNTSYLKGYLLVNITVA